MHLEIARVERWKRSYLAVEIDLVHVLIDYQMPEWRVC